MIPILVQHRRGSTRGTAQDQRKTAKCAPFGKYVMQSRLIGRRRSVAIQHPPCQPAIILVRLARISPDFASGTRAGEEETRRWLNCAVSGNKKSDLLLLKTTRQWPSRLFLHEYMRSLLLTINRG